MRQHRDIINIAAPSSLKMHAVFPPWLAAYSKLKQIKFYEDLETKPSKSSEFPKGKEMDEIHGDLASLRNFLAYVEPELHHWD